MKRILIVIMAVAASFWIACSSVFAAETDLAALGDEELKTLYENVRAEMVNRGLPLSKEITLREGKFIIGDDVLPGTYTVTCLETDGEKIGDAYSSLGSALDSMDEENSGAGGIMDALGGMMKDVAPVTVNILGDYGSVLKSFELKSGESSTITLEENTAIEITGGTVSLESE